MINKWIRRHILWEYWFVLVLMILSILSSILYEVNPVKAGFFVNRFIVHINTFLLIIIFVWLRFLKKRLNQSED